MTSYQPSQLASKGNRKGRAICWQLSPSNRQCHPLGLSSFTGHSLILSASCRCESLLHVSAPRDVACFPRLKTVIAVGVKRAYTNISSVLFVVFGNLWWTYPSHAGSFGEGIPIYWWKKRWHRAVWCGQWRTNQQLSHLGLSMNGRYLGKMEFLGLKRDNHLERLGYCGGYGQVSYESVRSITSITVHCWHLSLVITNLQNVLRPRNAKSLALL